MFTSPGAIAFQFGPLAIRWYGILIATGVLLGTTLAHREAIRRGQDPDKVLNAIVLTVLVALLGARVYYVLFNWEYYAANPAKILAVWEGGLAIHGGLIAGALATLL
ncbi:MAG: prolipoprotein diacylglyceryl transferase family protein, partial [candidate division NC10 bacterium]